MPKLFSYQVFGSYWLANKRTALLADEMGLGKTPQAVVAGNIALSKIRHPRVLIICPAVVRTNWKKEWERFSEAREFSYRVFYSKEDFGLHQVKEEILIVSYDLLVSYLSFFNRYSYDLVVCDEAHFLKSPYTKRSMAVLGNEGIARLTKRLWCLSGTPAPNHAGELWPILRVAGKTTMSYENFIRNHCTYYMPPQTRTSYEFKPQITGTKKDAISKIKQMLSPTWFLRRMKKEVIKDMPEMSIETLYLDPPKLSRNRAVMDLPLFEEGVSGEEILARVREETLKAENLLSLPSDEIEILKGLSQSISTLRMLNGLQKVEEIANLILSELEAKSYHRLVIFCVHRVVIEKLSQCLTKRPDLINNIYVISGKTKAMDREKFIEGFQADDKKVKIFIGNIQAAGTGITLTKAHQVILLEESFVPGDNAQAIMRVHRIGQKLPVTVRRAVLADSIDERISAILTRKLNELSDLFSKNVSPNEDMAVLE